MGTRKNSVKVSASDILALVRSRSEWAARAVSVSNPERVATVTDAGMFDANGTKLRAYVNASGVALLETNEEYKIRKGIARDAKIARKSATQPAQPERDTTAKDAAAYANATATAKKVSNRKNSGKAISALADAVSAPDAVAIPEGMTDSPTKNSAISAITRKLETLGMTRESVEANAGYALTDCSVRQLRSLNDVLGQRIMDRAKKS